GAVPRCQSIRATPSTFVFSPRADFPFDRTSLWLSRNRSENSIRCHATPLTLALIEPLALRDLGIATIRALCWFRTSAVAAQHPVDVAWSCATAPRKF